MERVRRHACHNTCSLLPFGLLAGLLCLLCPFSAKGQEVLVGVTTDIAQEYQRMEIPVFSTSSPGCGLFENGWGTAASLGGQISLASRSGSRLGLTARLSLSPSLGLLTTQAPESFAFYSDRGIDSGKVLRAAHEYQLSIKEIGVRLDFLLDYSITDRLRIHLGPSFSFILGTTVEQSDYITDATYRFDGGARKQEMTRLEPLAPQKLVIGSRAGISYAFSINENTLFVPELLMRTEFTSAFQQADRIAFGPGIGFSLLTRLADGYDDRDTVVDDIPPPDTTPFVPLQASISLRGTTPAGEALPWGRIRIYETMRRTKAAPQWQIERASLPPTLLVEPDYTSSNGIKEWSILFRYKGSIIGATSSREEGHPTSMNWKIMDDEVSDTPYPLTVELTVIDSAGATVTTSDQVPLKIERLTRIVDDKGDSVLYTLYPVLDDSAEAAARNHTALREVVGALAQRDKIEVLRVLQRNSDGSVPDIDISGPPAREADLIVQELKRLLKEKDKNVPVEIGLRLVEALPYTSTATENFTRPGIEVVIVRQK